jgi:hypothetical protein
MPEIGSVPASCHVASVRLRSILTYFVFLVSKVASLPRVLPEIAFIEFIPCFIVSHHCKRSNIGSVKFPALSLRPLQSDPLRMAPCLVEREVENALSGFYDDHGHFSAALTLNRMLGQVYKPRRASDVKS